MTHLSAENISRRLKVGDGNGYHSPVAHCLDGTREWNESATLEAARSSSGGRGWGPSGRAPPWEYRAAHRASRCAPGEAREPGWGTAKGGKNALFGHAVPQLPLGDGDGADLLRSRHELAEGVVPVPGKASALGCGRV